MRPVLAAVLFVGGLAAIFAALAILTPTAIPSDDHCQDFEEVSPSASDFTRYQWLKQWAESPDGAAYLIRRSESGVEINDEILRIAKQHR